MESNKLNEISENYIKIISKLLNDDKNPKIKESFYYFLYNDVLSLPEDLKISDKNISEEIEDSYDTISNYLDDIYSKNNVEENIVNKYLKNTILNKKKEIKKKIDECDKEIKNLNKIYINMVLQKYIPTNQTDKLNFKDRSVFNLKKNTFKYILGEFFIRFIFTLVSLKNKDFNQNYNFDLLKNNLDINNFYNFNSINNYISLPPSINSVKLLPEPNNSCENNYINYFKFNNDFNSISNQFKYWILFTFVDKFFSSNINFDSILNLNEFKKTIDKYFIKNPIKKKIKKNKKSKKGGNKNSVESKIKLLLKKQNKVKFNFKSSTNSKSNSKNNKKKKDEYGNMYKYKINIINILSNIKIYFENNKLDVNFYSYYNKPYLFSTRNYFYNIIQKNPNNKYNYKELNINNPFNISYYNNLYDFNDSFKENTKNKYSFSQLKNCLCNNNPEYKYTLFNSLRLYQDTNNENIISIFFTDFKYYLVIILYTLYLIKINIYKNYIKAVNDYYNLNNSNSVNNSNSENNKNTNSKLNNKNNIIKNKKNIKRIKNNKNISKNILISYNKIKSNIEEKYKNNISEFNKKILEYDNKVKKIFIEKYSE